MFEQAQIQEFKEVGGFGRNDCGSLMQCDLQLFPQRFQIGDSWFAASGSTPAFEWFYFKSAINNSVTSLSVASPQSVLGARTPQRSRRHPGEQRHVLPASSHPPCQELFTTWVLGPCTAGSWSCVDPSHKGNWSQLGELMAQAVLPSWSHPGVRGVWPRRGSIRH